MKENIEPLMARGLVSVGWSNKQPAILDWEGRDPDTGEISVHQLCEIQFSYQPIEALLESGKKLPPYPIPSAYLHYHLREGVHITSLAQLTVPMIKSAHVKTESNRDTGRGKADEIGIGVIPKTDASFDWAVEMGHQVATMPPVELLDPDRWSRWLERRNAA